MAEKRSEAGRDGLSTVVDTETEVNAAEQSSKRCSSASPSSSPAPPRKSPRTDFQAPTTRSPGSKERHSDTNKPVMETENSMAPSGPSVSSTARRKSWRRATITQRSLPALLNQYQVLCRDISTTLPRLKRLEKLMESSMRLVIERTQNSLQSVPKASLESFHKQVEHMHKDWACLAESINSETQDPQPSSKVVSSSDPLVQGTMDKVQKAINRLRAESESWEALLNKHRSKAEELKRKVEQGQENGVSLDSTSVAQSSQYHLIQSKPDYHSLLCRQQPKLHTLSMIMDTQCKMVKALLFIKEQSQLVVKKTSGQLAAEAGFEDLSPDFIRKLIAAPLSATTDTLT